MSVDPKCVRALLLLLDERLVPRGGKRPAPVKLKLVAADPPGGFTADEVYAAGQYIAHKGFASIAVKPSVDPALVEPRKYQFLSLTASGADYLSVSRSDQLFRALASRFGNIFEASTAELLAAAAKIGLKHLCG